MRFSITACLGLLLVSAPTRAQLSATSPLTPERQFTPGEEPPRSAWERVGLRGIELQVRAGVMVPAGSSPVQAPGLYPAISGDATGSILEGKESPYGPDVFGISVALGYRFLPSLSVGAFFSYASFAALDGTDTGDYADTTSQLERQLWTVGAYGRYYITSVSRRLQPWVELGVGYADDNANYFRAAIQMTGSGGAELSQYLLETQGLVVPLSVGLDWRLAPAFSFGPTIGYSGVFPLRGCVTVNVDQQSPLPGVDTCNSPPTSIHGYGVFSAGAFVKITFGPWTSR
jgi:hypothetical protein